MAPESSFSAQNQRRFLPVAEVIIPGSLGSIFHGQLFDGFLAVAVQNHQENNAGVDWSAVEHCMYDLDLVSSRLTGTRSTTEKLSFGNLVDLLES